MTQYASYDPTIPSPSPVLGWYDTVAVSKTLPIPGPNLALIEVPSSDWPNNAARISGWAVSSGVLVAYTPPVAPLSLAQQAVAAINAGLIISLSGSLSLSPTLFPIDPATQLKLNSTVNQLNASGGLFFNKATTGLMKDMMNPSGWHSFTAPQYLAVAEAIGSYVSTLSLIIDGNPNNLSVLPVNNVALTV